MVVHLPAQGLEKDLDLDNSRQELEAISATREMSTPPPLRSLVKHGRLYLFSLQLLVK